jgi:hypothetical protein
MLKKSTNLEEINGIHFEVEGELVFYNEIKEL